MKSSLALLTFASAFAFIAVNAVAVNKRADDDLTSTALDEPKVLIATKVFPTLVDEEPFLATVTQETTWTQYPATTSSA
ncbi:hypothetical protein D9758_017078 [Tetrapyrgos nigripes]|uniref:Uncharacterized protein n=1 Tax=Tetrapyrgos nigripes TaxID=182062 RepID=A0A8H5BHT8_9AGAR|nr:hypothetical protein D9758_017078 [Tetrapyrgos nigripes]